jgi:hypothetical protein
MTHGIPPGFERCSRCGEFNGRPRAKRLNWNPEPPRRVGNTPPMAPGTKSGEGARSIPSGVSVTL